MEKPGGGEEAKEVFSLPQTEVFVQGITEYRSGGVFLMSIFSFSASVCLVTLHRAHALCRWPCTARLRRVMMSRLGKPSGHSRPWDSLDER